MYQMDPQHSGRSPHAGPLKPAVLRAFDLSQLETREPGDPRQNVESSAAVGPDGTIYLGHFPGNLVALRDPGRGNALELAWRFHPAGASSFHATPALGQDGTVYIGFSTGGATPEAKGTFYALRPDGNALEPRVLWKVDLGNGRQTSSPTLGPDGTIYVTSGAGKLFALAPDGAIKWTAQTGPSLKAAPAIGTDGTVFLSSMNGKVYAVAPPAGGVSEGSVRWAFDIAAHPGRAPLVAAKVPPPGADGVGSGSSPTVGADGTLYVGANNSNFYAIRPDGTLRWMFEAEREVAGIWSTAALSADGSTLYFGANKGGIYALNAADGTRRWQFPIYGSVYNSPTLDSRGTLYTGSTLGHIYALNAATGELVLDFNASDSVWTAPAIRPDGSLVVATTKGRVLLLGEQ
jgi:outer membrane protein assembly factor BamB